MAAVRSPANSITFRAYTFSGMLLRAAIACCLATFSGAALASAQNDFAAEIVDLQKAGSPTLAKIYFAKDKRRIEMQATSGDDAIILPLVQPTSTQRGTHFQVGGQGDSIIMDFASKTSTVLWTDQKYYSTASMKKLMPAELYGLYASIHPQNVDDACGEWMRWPGAEGESCRNLGREKVNGRNTVKCELSCYGEICRLWIDNELRVLVKRESKCNSTELRRIQEGPLPSGVFDVPADYNNRGALTGIVQPTYPQ